MRAALRIAAAGIVAWLLTTGYARAQSTHLLIIVGLPGDPEHGELFNKWGTTLAATATDKLGIPKDHVTLLSDQQATRESVIAAFGTLASKVAADDTVAIVLFGFGTYANKVAKFNLRGPDMTPEDFATQLARLKSTRIVFVDTTSASAPFIEALSGPGRVVVTATRTGGEVYATLFGGPFVEAFSNDAADADHDGKVSILEAFEYARKTVAASYQREGLLPTEHPLLDDNGDKEGTLEPSRDAKDGANAAALSLGALHQQPLPADEKLRALYLERQDLERRIDALKLLKSGMDPQKYATELEKLATELALKTRQIHEAEAKGK
jgi:hypothetical protein